VGAKNRRLAIQDLIFYCLQLKIASIKNLLFGIENFERCLPMKTIFKSTFVLATLLSFTTAQAAQRFAELSATEGKVLVNQGKGFVPATVQLSLKVGDQLMVGENASAVLAYTSGCQVTLAAGQVFAVPQKPPCNAGEQVAMIDGATIMPAKARMGKPPAFKSPYVRSGGPAFTPIAILGLGAVAGGVLLLTRKCASAGC
jgi:hypothetical protein